MRPYMTDYTIEERCDIHETLMYVIMRNGKDYVRADDKITANEVVKKLYIADMVISSS